MARFVIAALSATCFVFATGRALAAEPAHGEDAKSVRAEPVETKEEMPEERTHLSLAVTPLLPVGDLATPFAAGLGATIGIEHSVHPHVQIVGRTGYAGLFPKQGINWSYQGIPLWGGARYTFGAGEGAYLEGLLGPSVIIASASVRVLGTTHTASDSEVKLGTSFGAGYQKGRFDVGARIAFWNLAEAGDSTTLMASLGWSFAAF